MKSNAAAKPKPLSLTAGRRDLIDRAYTEWLAAGLSTEPADFDAAEAAVTALYAATDRPRPYFVRLSSPLAAELYINLLCQTWPELAKRGQLWDQLGGQLLRFMGTWFAGSWDFEWMWLDAGRRVGAVYGARENAMLDAHVTVCRSVGWWYPFNDFVILTDRPEHIRRDEQARPHHETEMAVRYRDGTGMHAWHGTRAPDEWFDGKLPAAGDALKWENMEQRRVACEMIGWARILEELEARTIDTDKDPEIGELVEVDIPDIGRERFLRVRCGTGRTFALAVPPNMRTALEANAWTWGVEPQEYHPEVRT